MQAALDRAAAAAAAITLHHITRTLQAPLSVLRSVPLGPMRAENAQCAAQRILPANHVARLRHLHADGAGQTSSQWADLALGPRAYMFLEYFDFSETACPLVWPHCSQPLFFDADEYALNVTVLNLRECLEVSQIRFGVQG